MEFYYAQYVPYSYQYPDLGLIVEIETSEATASPPSPPNFPKWIYLIGALATLGLVSFSFLGNISQIEEASEQIQQDIYAEYSSLIR